MIMSAFVRCCQNCFVLSTTLNLHRYNGNIDVKMHKFKSSVGQMYYFYFAFTGRGEGGISTEQVISITKNSRY